MESTINISLAKFPIVLVVTESTVAPRTPFDTKIDGKKIWEEKNLAQI